ncbi:hypothetical protein DW322_03220 [Rhodococcus rhodnii]|uniref:Uncharacterized protein n=2 Tax=Rhodococcus rhodnii TaxID=38312 RepID=R7WKM5_9NOCA|nr:hypothetical protein [Rhodococcus rhodnii]EOM74579.1 hypothetical protein Rrhod_4051 [Rhodococcus rhodnii LMG 5362]TXG89426.1 hypothetical protein DW322_03220 [Rhodococcus rhodnii]
MSDDTTTTSDHDVIRRWVDGHDGFPARVPATESDGPGGVLRVDFAGGPPSADIEHLTWDQWFDIFDDRRLALEYKDAEYPGDDMWFAFVPRP